MTQLVTITDAAIKHIEALMAKAPADKNAIGLRLGVTNAGCSGMSYSLDYTAEENPLDIVVEKNGVKLIIDASAQMHVAGTEVDWNEDEFESGFKFTNPNVTASCGCGKSFKVD